ncbi:hypothetical protein FAGKG844_340049 [Frankia sp. AgKG'84/4]
MLRWVKTTHVNIGFRPWHVHLARRGADRSHGRRRGGPPPAAGRARGEAHAGRSGMVGIGVT